MRNETELERWDRNFHELLQELRLGQTGAQIVLAFVLALAFADRLLPTTSLWRVVYLATLTTAAIAMILFLAPVSLHRALFRRGRKPRVVVLAGRLARAALCCVQLAIVGTVFLVVHPMTNTATATVFAAGTFILSGSLWYVVPAVERRRAGPTHDDRSHHNPEG